MLAGTFYDQDGIIKGTHFSRTNLRSNINSQVKKWLKVGLNVSGGMSNNRLVSSSGDGYAGEAEVWCVMLCSAIRLFRLR